MARVGPQHHKKVRCSIMKVSKFAFTKSPLIEADSETIICLPSSYPFKSRCMSILRGFDIDSVISGFCQSTGNKNGINPQKINIIAVHPTIFATAIHLFVVIYSFIQTSVSGVPTLKFNSSINIMYYFRLIKTELAQLLLRLRFLTIFK